MSKTLGNVPWLGSIVLCVTRMMRFIIEYKWRLLIASLAVCAALGTIWYQIASYGTPYIDPDVLAKLNTTDFIGTYMDLPESGLYLVADSMSESNAYIIGWELEPDIPSYYRWYDEEVLAVIRIYPNGRSQSYGKDQYTYEAKRRREQNTISFWFDNESISVYVYDYYGKGRPIDIEKAILDMIDTVSA